MLFTVTVKPYPGEAKYINRTEPTRVLDCILLADIASPEKWSYRLGGDPVDGDTMISTDSTLFLLEKEVKGNRC